MFLIDLMRAKVWQYLTTGAAPVRALSHNLETKTTIYFSVLLQPHGTFHPHTINIIPANISNIYS